MRCVQRTGPKRHEAQNDEELNAGLQGLMNKQVQKRNYAGKGLKAPDRRASKI